MFSDVIAVRGLELACVVGVYPEERDLAQPLRVDLEMRLDTERCATSERISQTVDYDAVCSQLVFLLKSCRFGLLETAAHALARYVLAPPAEGERRATVQSVRLCLSKTAVLKGNAVASVEIQRDAEWVKLVRKPKSFGSLDIIFETREAGIYRINVAPGRAIPLHAHRSMQEAEMVLTSGLLCQGKPTRPGSVYRWPEGAAHTYENPSEAFQTILCVDRPPFIDSDEVLVKAEPVEVRPEHVFEL